MRMRKSDEGAKTFAFAPEKQAEFEALREQLYTEKENTQAPPVPVRTTAALDDVEEDDPYLEMEVGVSDEELVRARLRRPGP
jgi:hypothetical protein